MKRKVKVKVLLLTGMLLLISGIIWQSVMTVIENNRYLPVGDYLDVGTYQMHYVTEGSADTVFVFLTGSGTPCAYTDFYELQKCLSKEGQTISFDHAASGWSRPTKVPRTIDNLTEELELLIDTVAYGKQVILICHSLGSLEAIHYAQNHMEKMKGIIFLDSGSPQFYASDSESMAMLLNRGTALVRTIGLNRLVGTIGGILPFYGEDIRNQKLSGEIKKTDRAMYYRLSGNPYTLRTIQCMNENARVVLAGKRLGALPILVLSSESGGQWQEVQQQLTEWSDNSRQITVSGGAHYLHWSNPDEVLDAIRQFYERINGNS